MQFAIIKVQRKIRKGVFEFFYLAFYFFKTLIRRKGHINTTRMLTLGLQFENFVLKIMRLGYSQLVLLKRNII